MTQDITSFQQTVREYYQTYGRHDLPWRRPDPDGTFDPYKIMVSEIMLQQTQVPRVIPKFGQFLHRFPNVSSLADAPLGEVLKIWSGLGYNRRAKFLWQAVQAIQQRFGSRLPTTKQELVGLPGIGPNTAGAILTYAYNQRQVFIETNVRTVCIHHFFADESKVADKDLERVVQSVLPSSDYREWYWALMDYGTHLKQVIGNVARRSTMFAKQSRFEGSKRQVRGAVLRYLQGAQLTKAQLVKQISDERLEAVLNDLQKEGLIVHSNDAYMLPYM
ncbi:MAG TPA: hypothetical protein VFB59_02040 [Candidatus Saccharimonadales bacterium]|nr:hypothetical protein [Candidatus Saccharimonadales bacterium]